jgi:hypothetical protein
VKARQGEGATFRHGNALFTLAIVGLACRQAKAGRFTAATDPTEPVNSGLIQTFPERHLENKI